MHEVAIIGMGCLFPGAETPEQFWESLVAGRDASSALTAEETLRDPALFYGPKKGVPEKTCSLQSGVVRGFTFNPEGYDLPPDELARLDPLYQWTLYAARQALADAGRDGDALARCGLVLGNLSNPTHSSKRLFSELYRQILEPAAQRLLGDDRLRLAGLGDVPDSIHAAIMGYPAALAAQALGLGGPRFALDAACASSLYAVQLSCHYLQAGLADLMLAGAVCRPDHLHVSHGFSVIQAFPEDGEESRPLDRSSRGIMSGEGAAALVLKRHADAVRDGDRVYAVVEGAGLSNDGAGKHFLSPNPKGQALALERAYGRGGGGGAPGDVDYVECHATGTPLGDQTELNTLERFFGADRPRVGAVKPNLGHLLSAAGMAGVIKVALAMSKGVIPATIGVGEPVRSEGGAFSGNEIVRENAAWPAKGRAKRAAVNAFGFGGTNAHLVLREGAAGVGAGARVGRGGGGTSGVGEPLAIVGMDARFGSVDGLEAFTRCVYEGEQAFGALPADRWLGVEAEPGLLEAWGLEGGRPPRGAYLDRVEVDFLDLKVPANDSELPLQQQLLMLDVADRALKDAGFCRGAGRNVAVLVGAEMELTMHRNRARLDVGWQVREGLGRAGLALTDEQEALLETLLKDGLVFPPRGDNVHYGIGNLIANRISSLWDLTGPSFTVSAQENSVPVALEVARLLLASEGAEAVVVGGVDLAGGLEHVLWRNGLAPVGGRETLSFDRSADGWLVGEGAGAVVLKRLRDAERDGDRIYARLDAVELVPGRRAGGLPLSASVQAACEGALAQAGLAPDAIGYVEAHGSGIAAEDEAEWAGLRAAYAGGAPLSCAVGSVKANVGHAFAASGIASLIKAALCLHHRFVPATPGWSAPEDAAAWAETPFYVASTSRLWTRRGGVQPRAVAVSGLSLDGSCAHLILSDPPQPGPPAVRTSTNVGTHLFALAAADRAGLLDGLAALEGDLEAGAPLAQAAAERYAPPSGQAPYRLALLGRSREEVLGEVRAARDGVGWAFEGGREWTSPRGSSCTARPLGREGGVALAYPMAGVSYPEMGADLVHRFPQLFPLAERYAEAFPEAFNGALLHPRSVTAVSADGLARIEAELMRDRNTLFASALLSARLNTALLRDVFGLKPAAALGCSLGEICMMWALGLLKESASGRGRVIAEAVEETTRFLFPDAAEDWATYYVLADAEDVRGRLRGEGDVHLTIACSPGEVMISGRRAASERFLDGLGALHFPMPYFGHVHTPLARAAYEPVYHALAGRLGFDAAAGVTCYSAAYGAPVAMGLEPVVDALAHTVCEPVDFAGLVRRVHADGARVFIDVGPRDSCARWIEQTLEGDERVVVALDRKGKSSEATVMAALARLWVHGVGVDLAPLYANAGRGAAAAKKRSFVKAVSAGWPRIYDRLLTEANRDRLRPRASAPPTSERPAPPPRPHAEPPTSPDVRPGLLPSTGDGAGGARALPALNRRDAQVHALYLKLQTQFYRQIGDSLLVGPAPPAAEAPAPREPAVAAPARPAIWDEAAILEMTEGKLSNVLGPAYTPADAYPRRARMPSPPFLFVSRVTGLDAQKGRFEPCAIEWEYDVPLDTPFRDGDRVSPLVPAEACHCLILLLSYLGCDEAFGGRRRYRVVDSALQAYGLPPRLGERFRGRVRVTSFVDSGRALLAFYEYECRQGDRLILRSEGCGGMFSDEDLAATKGIAPAPRPSQPTAPAAFEPPLRCPKRRFEQADVERLLGGDVAGCFGPGYAPAGALTPGTPAYRMLHRVTDVDPEGGPWGLGTAEGTWAFGPDHWAFRAHFKDDPILPGTLMQTGTNQLLAFYLLFLGLRPPSRRFRAANLGGVTSRVKFRGQVPPEPGLLTYRCAVKRIEPAPCPYLVADAEVLYKGKTIVASRDLGVALIPEDA